MRLVEISQEEYRILFDAGAWVWGCDFEEEEEADVLSKESDADYPFYRNTNWAHYYTRTEDDGV